MAIEPNNITGQVVTWMPTSSIRLYGKTRKKADLQQLWKNLSSGETEWRDIEFTHSHIEED
jgi:hypothetical protein